MNIQTLSLAEKQEHFGALLFFAMLRDWHFSYDCIEVKTFRKFLPSAFIQ